MTVNFGDSTVEIGVVTLSNTNDGNEQFESSHPFVMPGYWRVDGDSSASGELRAAAGGWSFLGFLEVGVASPGIYRVVGSAILDFGYGSVPDSWTSLGVRVDCSASGGFQLRSANGTWWKITVSDAGAISATAV